MLMDKLKLHHRIKNLGFQSQGPKDLCVQKYLVETVFPRTYLGHTILVCSQENVHPITWKHSP